MSMTQKHFSPEEKLHIVRQLISGEKYLSQLSREYGVSHTAISNWRQAYQSKGEAAFFSSASESQERSVEVLEARVAELECFCGQLAMENSVLKKYCVCSHRATAPSD
jgi:transposase